MSKKCPACGQPSLQQYRPFCSKFCKDRDLLNWLNERYTISSPHQEEAVEDEIDELLDDKT